MNRTRKLWIVLLVALLTPAIYAEESFSYADLQPSQGVERNVKACKYYGQEKQDKQAVASLINLLRDTTDSKVAVESAIALGYIKENGAATTALKDKIESTKDSDVVYASLIAILNITVQNKTYEPAAKQALEYADQNHRSDEFVSDIIDRIKAKLRIFQ
ncbi:MAG: HEAT repeat domain-containing protein [Spirochaetota bacterium]